MDDAKAKGVKEIDHVVMVGGMTRMPAVQEKVKELTGKEPHRGVNPDEVVAVGAAIQAGVINKDVKDVLLLDVTPLTLGIETKGGVMTKLIERNTTIPTRKSEVFSTAEDNQPSVEIHVLQGEREMATYNKSLGKFQLTGIPPAPRGIPQIEVAFDIDVNGIVNVSAKDLGTGKEQKIEIRSGSGLSDDEIKSMIGDAEAHAEDDKRLRELAEARNAGESAAYQAEKQVKDLGEHIDDASKSEIEDAIAAVNEAVKGEDAEDIRAKTERLQTAFHKVSEAMYERAQAEQQPRAPQAEPNGSGPAAATAHGRTRRRSSTPRSSTSRSDVASPRSTPSSGARRRRSSPPPRRRTPERPAPARRASATPRPRPPASPSRPRRRPPSATTRPSSSRSPSARRRTSRTTASGWRARTPPRSTAASASSPRSCCPRSTTSTTRCKAAEGHEDVVKGFALVRDEIVKALGRVGIQPFAPKGEMFDPNEHEAMVQQPSEDAESGTVIEVYQQGYRINGQVLRPARVVVAA